MTTHESGRRLAGLEALRRHPDLDVFTAADAGYDAARHTWNTAFEHRPAAVVVPRSAPGVVEIVRFARARNISVAIQSTGHGPTREARDDAILINMGRMSDVRLDLERRRARIGGGARWQAVVDVVAPHGLAPLLGSSPNVSSVGYTLGGGLGWLARKYGASADSVHAFEVVTADGQLVEASATHNHALFWGLRGGGAGHLGVVTAMEVELYPVAEVYGGNLFYPAEMAVDVMRRWREWLPELPEELTSGVTLINFPALDAVPPPLRGRSLVTVRGAFTGGVEDGERLLAYWRDWRMPELDMFGPLPFARIAEVSQDPVDPLPAELTGGWLRALSNQTIDELVAGTFPEDGPRLLLFTELRHAGGALSRGSSEASAFGNRDASILMEILAMAPTGAARAAIRAHTSNLKQRIAGDLTGGIYLNFVEGDDRRHGVTEGVGEASYRRLAALKAAIDPDDLFDHGLDVT